MGSLQHCLIRFQTEKLPCTLTYSQMCHPRYFTSHHQNRQLIAPAFQIQSISQAPGIGERGKQYLIAFVFGSIHIKIRLRLLNKPIYPYRANAEETTRLTNTVHAGKHKAEAGAR